VAACNKCAPEQGLISTASATFGASLRGFVWPGQSPRPGAALQHRQPRNSFKQCQSDVRVRAHVHADTGHLWARTKQKDGSPRKACTCHHFKAHGHAAFVQQRRQGCEPGGALLFAKHADKMCAQQHGCTWGNMGTQHRCAMLNMGAASANVQHRCTMPKN